MQLYAILETPSCPNANAKLHTSPNAPLKIKPVEQVHPYPTPPHQSHRSSIHHHLIPPINLLNLLLQLYLTLYSVFYLFLPWLRSPHVRHHLCRRRLRITRMRGLWRRGSRRALRWVMDLVLGKVAMRDLGLLLIGLRFLLRQR